MKKPDSSLSPTRSPQSAKLAEDLQTARADVFALQPPVPGSELMRRHSDALDRVLTSVLEAAVSAAGGEGVHDRALSGLALVATGGYGRRELAPYSDVDVTFMADDDQDADANRVVKEAFHLLMDVVSGAGGLKIGYAYRTLDDYDTLDHITRTALLDSRLISGNRELVDTFTRDLRGTLGARFVLEQARSRPGASDPAAAALYAVEPDVKSGPGGLRDIHTVGWIGEALFDCGPETVWRELIERRVLAPAQATELRECRDFLSSVRNALHLAAGKQMDTLTIERQAEVAPMLGIESDDELMGRYYRCAEKVRWVCGALTQALVSRRLPVDRMFFLTSGALALADKTGALHRPGVIARAFRHAQECRVGFSPQLEEQVRAAAESVPAATSGAQSFAEFRAILDGSDVYGTLSQMAGLGVLQRLVPEFGGLLHRVPAERVHQFTIGEHSLLVLRRLEEMRAESDTLYAGIWSSVRDPAALLFSALVHDIGKSLPDGADHSETGAVAATALARRLGFSETSAAVVKSLVANHEVMSAAARRYDINSPASAAEFAQALPDIHMLRKLFLLSVADAMSVGQQSYAQMQRRFLEELYFAAELRLLGPTESDDADRAERYRRRLKRTLTLANLPQDMVTEHCEVMPPSYLLNTRPDRMAAHIDAVASVRKGRPVVRLDEDMESHITELTVCAPDSGPGLLSRIAGVLFALDVTVHYANVFTRRASDEIAIDTLSVDYLQGRLPYFKRKEVETELLRMLAGKTTTEELLAARGKSEVTAHANSVHLLGRQADSHSVVEVRADDIDGLLYHITRTIARLGWNILSARITTQGHEAVDAFAIADPVKGRLPAAAANLLRQALAGE